MRLADFEAVDEGNWTNARADLEEGGREKNEKKGEEKSRYAKSVCSLKGKPCKTGKSMLFSDMTSLLLFFLSSISFFFTFIVVILL